MYIVEAGLKLEPRVPVPYHPREQEACSHPPPLARTRASEEIGLRARDVWFLVTVASEVIFPDATVQSGRSDTLPFGEDRKSSSSSSPLASYSRLIAAVRYITVGVIGGMVFLRARPLYYSWW
jgi:hypothetical protein